MNGALDWINLNRVYEIDENVIANKKKDSVHPEKNSLLPENTRAVRNGL